MTTTTEHKSSQDLIAKHLKLIQPDDYRLLKSSSPSSSGSGSSHLVRADRGIAEWHRLQKEALEANRLQHAETEIQKTG
ncbi:MAG TPA: hypothetical protein PKD05_07365 [Candidatus Melainabacteria bacterium]|nr:hypothetical protein [Candidatus Melainabacteria bacterium]